MIPHYWEKVDEVLKVIEISPKSALNVRRKCSWVELAHNLGYIAPHQITTKDKCKFASL